MTEERRKEWRKEWMAWLGIDMDNPMISKLIGEPPLPSLSYYSFDENAFLLDSDENLP